MHLISGTIRSTPLPLLPVLTNIEPPALRCRAATDKLIMQAECHRDWPLYDEVFYPPSLCLEGRGGEGKIKVGEGTREPGKRGVRR